MSDGVPEKEKDGMIFVRISQMERRLEKAMKRNRNLILLQIVLSFICLALLVSSCSQMGLDDVFKTDGYSEKDLEGRTFRTEDDSLGFVSITFLEDGKGIVSEGGRAPDKDISYTKEKVVLNGKGYDLDIQLFFDYIEIGAEDGTSVVFSLVQ